MTKKGLGERIKILREYLGLTQEEFGRMIGRTKGSISFYEKGKRNPDKATLLLIEKAFNVNPEWIEKGEGNIFTEEDKYIPVEFYSDYSLSAGKGLATEYSEKTILQVSEKFIKEKLGVLKISGLISFPVYGDSMYPTIPDGAIGLFIDYRKENFLINGEIYAFKIDDTFYVKRIVKNPDKSITFVSDNEKYKPFTLKPEEFRDLFIIGRYIGYVYLK